MANPPPGASAAADGTDILTPSEVARLFRVDPKTVTRWAKAGLLPHFMTLGGHRRYRRADIAAIMAGLAQQAAVQAPASAESGAK